MKKKILCVLAVTGGLLFLNSEVNAQISVGPRVGINLSTISNDDDKDNDDEKYTPGLHAGVAVNIALSDVFSVQPEVLFTQKGIQLDQSEIIDDLRYSSESTTTLNYIQIPVLAKATFGDDTKFFINAGPSVGFAMGGKIKSSDVEIDVPSESEDKIDSGDMGLDIGIMVGAGLGAEVGSGILSLEGRYDYGLTEVLKDTKTNNRTIGVSISYMIPIGG